MFGYFNIAKEINRRFSVFLNLCIKNLNEGEWYPLVSENQE